MLNTQKVILATSITAIALVAAFLGAMVLIRPSEAATSNSSTTTTTLPPQWSGGQFRGGSGGQFQGGPAQFFGSGRSPFQGAPANLTVGQTITLTSASGHYLEVNDSAVNGTSSGTLTFTVSGKLAQGYTLTLSSGTITIGSTKYSISSGSAQTGPWANSLEGQGTTSSGGQFIVNAQAHGSFAGSSAIANLDLKVGGTEYLVMLSTDVQG